MQVYFYVALSDNLNKQVLGLLLGLFHSPHPRKIFPVGDELLYSLHQYFHIYL